jgi:hypothetical protein
MEWLGKLFFPGNPKQVRYRKLQLLFFTIALIVLACSVVGLMFYLVSRPGYT